MMFELDWKSVDITGVGVALQAFRTYVPFD